jgi:parallel beta-helix repeat protein
MSERKLDRKAISALMLALLLVGLLTMAFNIQPARAAAAIYIRMDGSIYPLTAPISTLDNVTYTFVDNLYDWRIVVEKDNIVIDGAGYTLQGTGSGNGIDLSGRTNVTVWNTQIMGFGYGIMLSSSSNCNVIDNTIAYNGDRGIYIPHNSACMHNSFNGNTITNNAFCGIWLGTSSNYNCISGNTIANNGNGILLSSHYTNISDNNITANSRSGMLIGTSHSSVSGNIITANNEYGIRFNEGSSNNSVSNNIITNNGDGIWLIISSNNNISGNTVTNNIEGITLYPSCSGNTVSGNTITDNCNIGVWIIHYNYYNSIVGNTIANNGEGITFSYSDYNNVSGNTFTNNGLVIGLHAYRNSAENNTVNGKPLVYLDGIANCSVGDAGQVILLRCDNIRVENLNLYRANTGVQLFETNNTIISGNTITANDQYGIELTSSSNNSVSGNTINNNRYGIRLYSSSNNIIYHNNFIDNTNQVYVYPSGYSNVWDDGYPSGGNYWSDYTERYPYASEFNGSGIWNRPYALDGSNQDSYPLIHIYVIPEFPSGIILPLFMVLSILFTVFARRKILKNRRKRGVCG